MGKTLTLSVVFQADSLNFGEGTANIAELKKYHRGNGMVHTFASRQSIRYDIVRLGNEMFGWNLNTVDKSKGVVQFKDSVSIADSAEMDLFGYLKTGSKSKKRPAVARLSHAMSLEPYKGEMEFLNNMGLAGRIQENPNIANIEHHLSYYTYTLSVDLERVGVDPEDEVVLPTEERIARVKQLLDILKVLYRDIKGRRESLAPVFAIGGVYPIANPLFLGRIELKGNAGRWQLSATPLQEALETTWNDQPMRAFTRIGIMSGVFANEAELASALGETGSIEQFFTAVRSDVEAAYGE